MMISLKEIIGEIPKSTPSFKINHNEKIGGYLADQDGRALYCFKKDPKWIPSHKSKHVYSNNDRAGIWQVFYKKEIDVTAPLNKKDFSFVERLNGQKQTTYKGSLLYYYANDINVGDTNGEGIGDLWFTVKIEI